MEKIVTRANRVYSFISHINRAIINAKDEATLFEQACNVAVNIGKFKMAWIGVVNDKTGRLAPVKHAPENIKYLREIKEISIKEEPEGMGPTGVAIREGKYVACNNILHSASMFIWRDEALKYDFQSSIALPIKKFGKSIGAFSLYSSERFFFDEEEIALLLEITADISAAVENIDKAVQHQKAEQEKKKSELRYRSLFDNMIGGLAYCKLIFENDIPVDFIYIDVNKSFGTLTGLGNVIGKRVTEVIPKIKEDSHQLLETYSRVATSLKAERFELYLKSLDMWFDISVFSNERGYFTAVFDVITQRKKMEDQREFDKNNLDALINNTKDLMWSVDLDFKLITCNKPFEEMSKKNFGRILKKGGDILSVAISPKVRNNFKKLYERTFSGECFKEISYFDSPMELWTEISYSPIRRGGLIVGAACHSSDITDRKRSEIEREKMISNIVLHSKNLEQFASIVSHNLRAPVANILGLSNVLKSEVSDNDKALSLKYLAIAAEQLDGVLKDLNKILQQRGTISEFRETVYFKELVDSIKLSIQTIIEKEGVLIYTDFTEVDRITTIKSYINSIFYNLISNSIKYRQPGKTPTIEIRSKKGDKKIWLSFKDNGMGINLSKYGNKVFGLYQRFHPGIEGKGLGLFMIKTQVETLGGTISINSKEGVGTEVEIEFPEQVISLSKAI